MTETKGTFEFIKWVCAEATITTLQYFTTKN